MCNENKCVILWLELQAEILLDKLTNDVLLVCTLTKSHSSLLLGPNLSCSPWVGSCGIPPGHQTHNFFLSCSHNSIMGPCNAWFLRDLAGLHHRCRGFDPVLQPVVSGSACGVPLCVPPQGSWVLLWKGRQGHEEQWVVHPLSGRSLSQTQKGIWRAMKPIFGQLNNALGVSCSSKLQQAWMWIWMAMLRAL